ncbi:MAG: methionine--tRNA ligase [Pseudomonadota bacterium]
MSKKTRSMMVTCSLLYANGDLHLGHMIEHIQTDIWARFQRMQGHRCLYICGSDCHGTPVMISAEKQNMKPIELVEKVRQQHMADFAAFNISFDNFYTSHSPENKALSEMIYRRLQDNGDISKHTIEQAFDAEKQMFLPDRFVKGQCPKCGAMDQYGDGCEVCGATYTPTELINPVSVVSGTMPVVRTSEHYFFELPRYEAALKKWMQEGHHLQPQVTRKMDEWFQQGLRHWNISRDKPYFGFEIPDAPGKYFYVWFDAPIGYMASLQNFCQDHPEIDFDAYWRPDTDTELYHFIGKDVMYFHSLFWPAMLMAAKLRTPTAVCVHGFLTVNGEKMSKSRGTFIKVKSYLKHFKPDYLRYYFAAKLNSSIEDIDLNLDDFRARVNADLVGKLVNIASRCAGFMHSHFNNTLAAECGEKALWRQFTDSAASIAAHYEQFEYAKTMREVMTLADIANQYISEQAPWQLIKDEKNHARVHAVCTMGINLFKVLMVYLKPVVPTLVQDAERFLNIEPLQWQDSGVFLGEHRINRFTPLLQRIQPQEINMMLENEKSSLTETKTQQVESPFKPEITIDDFAKVDLRVAKIISAEQVEGADKLLRITLDVGEGIKKQVFAGIKGSYRPEDLQDKQIIFVANLKPRKMRFGLSEGMILAAGNGQSSFVLSPDNGANAGDIVK